MKNQQEIENKFRRKNKMKTAKITIDGMHCASCASNIERSLKKTAGVKEATVSVMMKKGTVECDDRVSEAMLKDAVKRAGYNVKSVEFS
jgi:Cu+-exporting ATPase